MDTSRYPHNDDDDDGLVVVLWRCDQHRSIICSRIDNGDGDCGGVVAFDLVLVLVLVLTVVFCLELELEEDDDGVDDSFSNLG